MQRQPVACLSLFHLKDQDIRWFCSVMFSWQHAQQKQLQFLAGRSSLSIGQPVAYIIPLKESCWRRLYKLHAQTA